MDKPLSFSAYKRYVTCPQYYKYNDIDKIKAGRETSALLVGTILDESIMELLRGDKSQSEYLLIKGRNDARERVIDFYPDDLDTDLVNMADIGKYAESLGWKGDDITTALKDMLKSQETLSEAQYKVLNYACWNSLDKKIQAMYDSFVKWIYPQIQEVHDIQTHLDNGLTHGYLDFTATLKDGRKVLFDLKTSKMPYALDSVTKSPQLSLYASMHGYEYAGFIVLVKNLNKNKVKTCTPCGTTEKGGNRIKCATCKEKLDVIMEPTSYSQIIVDKVPQWNKDLTTKAMADTVKCIDAGLFPRNLNQCFYMYGKTCPYMNKCWKGE